MKHRQLLAAALALVLIAIGLPGCSKQSQESASPETTHAAAACAEHGVSQCPFCSPEVMDTMGFCNGHGVPEAICTRCRDDLEQVFRANNDWCEGHKLPESQCEACNPGVLDKWKATDAQGQATEQAQAPCSNHGVKSCPFCSPSVIAEMGFCKGHGVPEAVCTKCRDDLENAFRSEGDWCDEHGLPESHCETCNPDALEEQKSSSATRNGKEPKLAVSRLETPRVRTLPSLTCSTESSVITLATPEMAERIGVVVEEVQRGKLRKTLEAPATVEYDSRFHARLSPRAAGTVVEVRRDLGDHVEAGEVLVVLDSAALAQAKSELIRASSREALWEKNSLRERGLLEQGLTTAKDTLGAETELVESRIALSTAAQQLAIFGLTEEQIERVKEESEVSSLLSITAPFAGVVVGLDAVLGELASPETSVVGVADTSRMWVMINVAQKEIRLVERGQPVLLTVEGWAGETLGGRVTWLSSDVDGRTRTVKVRAEFENPDGILRAQSFGSARIITRDEELAVLVPKGSVQWEGCCNVAFERTSPTEFVPRKLRLGYDAGDYYEVLAGLSGGEVVVTQGSFILKTELRKGSIGAGCCEVGHLDE